MPRLVIPFGHSVWPFRLAIPFGHYSVGASAGLPSIVPIPRPNRIYFKFLTPIDTAEVECDLDDPQQCADLYKCVVIPL